MDAYNLELSLESGTFEKLKIDFDTVLQKLLANMKEKNSDEGSVSMKLEVNFDREFIANYDPMITGENRECIKPKFAHKITSVMQIKDDAKGSMHTDMELYYNEDTGKYEMRPVMNTKQRTIFDCDFREMNREEYEETIEGNTLTGRKVAALPAPMDDEPQDGAEEENGELPYQDDFSDVEEDEGFESFDDDTEEHTEESEYPDYSYPDFPEEEEA